MSTISPGNISTYNTNPSPKSSRKNFIIGVLMVGTFIAAKPLLNGLETLLSILSHDLAKGAVSVIILSGFTGIFAGVAGALLKRFTFKVHLFGKSLISASFNKSLANFRMDKSFWGHFVIGGLVGWMVGAWMASSGFTSVPELSHGVYSFENLIPIHSGGFGGHPPPTNLFAILYLMLKILACAILAGVLCGWIATILLSTFAGMTKGIVKQYIMDMLHDPKNPHAKGITNGALGGFYIGLITGIIQMICSIIGIIRFSN